MDTPIKKRILIIEDDIHIAEGLELNLRLQGYEVKVIHNGLEGLETWKEWHPHLVVLDLMLPGMDGMQILKNIRLEDERIPILILSAKVDPSDRVEGFADGVDDYMIKPFSLEELLLRVQRLLQRDQWQREQVTEGSQNSTGPRLYTFGINSIDFATGHAHCSAGNILLTEQERKLLKLFIVNKGKPLSRSRLLEIGWGYTKGTSTRTVDNYIVRFRRYFEENPKKPLFFRSRRSLGYIFDHD